MPLEHTNPMKILSYAEKKSIMIDLLKNNQVPEEMLDQFINLIRAHSNFTVAMTINIDKNTERIKFINNAYNATNLINKIIATVSNGMPFNSQVSTNRNIETMKKSSARTEPFDKIVTSTDNTRSNIVTTDQNPSLPTTVTSEVNAPDISICETLETTSASNNIVLKENVSDTDGATIQTNKSEDTPPKEITTTEDQYEDHEALLEIIKQEIDSWQLDATKNYYTALLSLPNIQITKEDSISDVIGKLAEYMKLPKFSMCGALSRAYKNAKFENSKYIPVLRKINKKDYDRDFMLQQLIDFCLG